jgi:hypothetical protein
MLKEKKLKLLVVQEKLFALVIVERSIIKLLQFLDPAGHVLMSLKEKD